MSSTEAMCLQRALAYYNRFSPVNGSSAAAPGSSSTPNGEQINPANADQTPTLDIKAAQTTSATPTNPSPNNSSNSTSSSSIAVN